jgi:hypothetical protein
MPVEEATSELRAAPYVDCMPTASQSQAQSTALVAAAPTDVPAVTIDHRKVTPSRLDAQRMRWLAAALRQCPWLSPLELSAYVTLLWRGRRWLSTDTFDCECPPEKYRYGVVASMESLAASVGRQRPGRAPEGARPRPSKALGDACRNLVSYGLVDRENQTYKCTTRGRFHSTPYRWWRQAPKGVERVGPPAWPKARLMIRRIAVQQSVHGPARDSILIRLALVADERGRITVSRTELERICRCRPTTALGHLQALQEAGYGVARVFRFDAGGRRHHRWHIRLMPIPDGEVPGEERREREAETAARLRERAAEQRSRIERRTSLAADRPGEEDDIPF